VKVTSKDNLIIIKRYVEEKIDIDVTFQLFTILWYIASNNYKKVLEYLVQLKSNVN
jgi:hypothetical protein